MQPLISVSYTHLDVYKRQNMGRYIKWLEMNKSKGESLFYWKKLLKGYEAVSYTHLDVYKRQQYKF